MPEDKTQAQIPAVAVPSEEITPSGVGAPLEGVVPSQPRFATTDAEVAGFASSVDSPVHNLPEGQDHPAPLATVDGSKVTYLDEMRERVTRLAADNPKGDNSSLGLIQVVGRQFERAKQIAGLKKAA